jgi:hypothetical protein
MSDENDENHTTIDTHSSNLINLTNLQTNSVQVLFHSSSLNDIIPENVQVEPEATQALGQLIEQEVKEIVEMLLETTAVQGKYTAQDIRQLLSLKGFNICY